VRFGSINQKLKLLISRIVTSLKTTGSQQTRDEWTSTLSIRPDAFPVQEVEFKDSDFSPEKITKDCIQEYVTVLKQTAMTLNDTCKMF
jgi:hypothetical protein